MENHNFTEQKDDFIFGRTPYSWLSSSGGQKNVPL